MVSPVRQMKYAGMSVGVFGDCALASMATAVLIQSAVRKAHSQHGGAVLGLATGSTPERVYSHLVALHHERQLSFREVTTYNLDEYYPIQPVDPRSYRSYMYRHLFQHVDAAPQRTHLLDGTVPERFVDEHCAGYDRWIAADGGLDLQLLGIGRNGHIGFNEPSDLPVADALRLATRRIELHPVTRADAVKEFGRLDQVIPCALTMGIATILSARTILILATGSHKAAAVARALTGPMTAQLPASLLQSVPAKVIWLLDEPAAGELP
jgi:glucosamine-6-phosphate deaminase